jgi:hypothetical protein
MLRQHGGNFMCHGIYTSPEAHSRLEAIYQAVLGGAMDASGWQTHSTLLANGWTLGQVCGAIAHSPEARNSLAAAYQSIWSQLIDPDYLAYYTVLIGTSDWTLAAIVQDEKERYLQTVVLPVLRAISISQ